MKHLSLHKDHSPSQRRREFNPTKTVRLTSQSQEKPLISSLTHSNSTGKAQNQSLLPCSNNTPASIYPVRCLGQWLNYQMCFHSSSSMWFLQYSRTNELRCKIPQLTMVQGNLIRRKRSQVQPSDRIIMQAYPTAKIQSRHRRCTIMLLNIEVWSIQNQIHP